MIKNDLIVATAIVLGFAASGSPCSVGAPLPTPQALVERAALIVHARAERGGPEAGQIRFRVIGVFKGSLSAGELVLNGQFEDRDDYNDRSVPYTFIRPGGRRGNCYALGYRRGGDYLLLLQPDRQGVWTPNWTPLGPTNEQILGESDPWLKWVVQRIGATKPEA